MPGLRQALNGTRADVEKRIHASVKAAARSAGVRIERVATVPHVYDAEPTLQMLVEFARSVRCDGDVAEAGVFQGRTASVLRRELPGRQLFLLDTFAGMPGLITEKDKHRAGDFADTSLELVKQRVGTDRTAYLPGLFSERLPDLANHRFAFVHLDCDLYQSLKECLDFFPPRMNAGGVILIDDYGFQSCPGAMQATDEWAEEVGVHPVWLPTGQAVVHFFT